MTSSRSLPRWTLASVLVLTAASAAPSGVGAQTESQPGCPSWRRDAEARPFPTQADFESLALCPLTAPPVLIAAWAHPMAGGSVAFRALVGASSAPRDLQLYRTIVGAAGDVGHPAGVRLGALEVLARYYDPRWDATPEWLTTAHVGDQVPYVAHYNHAPRPDASIVTEFPALVTRLAWNDPDPVVRDAALRLRAWLAVSNPAHTPVAPGSIALVAGCGSRVTVESFADVTIPFTLRVIGTPYQDAIALAGLKETLVFKAPPDGQPRKILKSLPAGTVTATVGGNEVARLSDTDRHKPCAPGIAPQ
jgi:hypothetical protein